MFSGEPRPSTVVIALPSMAATGVRHERRGSPSTSTVHAPQPPCWQPALGLVISSSSRSTCSSDESGGESTSCSTPLTVSLMVLLLGELGQGAADEHRQGLGAVPGGR